MSAGTTAWNRRAAEAAHERRAAVRGCTLDQYVDLRNMGKAGPSPIAAFLKQRRTAKARGIAWELTLWQWWGVWLESGHWNQRGKGQGYVMCRKGDTGAYAVGNVFIATSPENTSEGNRRNSLPRGVHYRDNRRKKGFRAVRTINGVTHRLGPFETAEEAHAAYLNAALLRVPTVSTTGKERADA